MPTLLIHCARLVLLLAVVIAPLPLIAHLLARHYVRASGTLSLSHMGLAALALWVIVESLVVSSLGLVGHLWIFDLVVIEGVVGTSGVWLLMRDRTSAASRCWHAMSGHVLGLARREPAERWLIGLAGGTLTLLFVQELWIPIQDYDSLAYQLPRVVEWYQRGAFAAPIPGVGTDPIGRYPFAWNTLFYLALAPMGHDQFILVPNLVAWLMLGLGTYGLVRLSGGQSGSGLSWAVLLLLMPLSVVNVDTAHNDLALGAMFLASVYFSIQAWQERNGWSILLAVACAAMMVGSKMSGIGYVGLLIALWLWLSFLSARLCPPTVSLPLTIRDHPLMAAVALASIAALGGSWYLRNAVETGNPLGFFQIRILGWVIFDGIVTQTFIDQTNLLHNFRPSDPRHWSILAEGLRHFPGFPGLLALATVALCAPRALLYRSDQRRILLIFLGLCLASLYLYVAGPWSAKQPYHADLSDWTGHQLRYSFPFWGLLAAVAGATIRLRVSRWISLVTCMVVSVSAVDALRHTRLFLELYPRRSSALLMCTVGLFFLVTMPALHGVARAVAVRVVTWRRWPVGMVVLTGIALIVPLMLLASATTVIALRTRRDTQDTLYGGIVSFIDSLPENTRVGFWGTDKTYLLYGKRLRRPLQYLAIEGRENREQLLAYLHSERVDVLAVGPAPEEFRWDRLTQLERDLPRIHGDDVRHHVLVFEIPRFAP